jgi:methylglyoxal synthase
VSRIPSSTRVSISNGEAIAMVAHDARKDAMVAFVREHFALLSRFPRRYATGTTGARLNELAAELGAGKDWVHRLKSGPLGGDAQLADLILERRCARVVFFEDPHVARQHEADIQLLERAARIATGYASCINDPETAERWAVAFERRISQRIRAAMKKGANAAPRFERGRKVRSARPAPAAATNSTRRGCRYPAW